ncbi:unnamed protein product [Calicophoron daubneyi]|uniref:glutathione-specific gamma-glutamylcyclotransferase n=1 Tax=Calicophoron daubneyi TaxID=300641 RepID=A0AAV2THG8_CALDB
MGVNCKLLEFFEFPSIPEFCENVINNDTTPFWVYAYGSLLWYPNFSFEERVLGYVHDVKRVMSQASFRLGDHDWPGRVATLIPCPGERTWGAAYKITGVGNKREAFQKMFEREIKQDYEFATVKFVPYNSSTAFKVAVYVALPEGPGILVPVTPEIEAYQIFRARGIIGMDKNYLYELAKFLKNEILPLTPDAADASNDYVLRLAALAMEYESGQRKLDKAQEEMARPKLRATNDKVTQP